MTIHSSKGLEFDTVILIDFHFKLMNISPTEEEHNDINKNMLYVAISRAKNNLHIFAVHNHISPFFD